MRFASVSFAVVVLLAGTSTEQLRCCKSDRIVDTLDGEVPSDDDMDDDDRAQAALQASAWPIGSAIADALLAVLDAPVGDKTDTTTKLVTALGRPGLDSFLWSPEFGEALKQELQETDILEQVMIPDVLNKIIRAKTKGMGVVIGGKLPKPFSTGKKVKAVGFIQSFSGEREKLTKDTKAEVNVPEDSRVTRLLERIDAMSFLKQSEPSLLRLMQNSSLLRRACTPEVLTRVMHGLHMKVEAKVLLSGTWGKTVTAEVRIDEIRPGKEDESRTCLVGVADEKLVLPGPDSDSGEISFAVGMGLSFAKIIGKDGLRYMLRRMQAELVAFLKNSGILTKAMTSAIFNQLLGAYEISLGVEKATFNAQVAAPKENIAVVKCVCDGECKYEKNQLDNPEKEINRPDGKTAILRCPLLQGQSDKKRPPLAMPCCASPDGMAACIGGAMQGVSNNDDSKKICKELPGKWHGSSRCMPSDPVLVADASSVGKWDQATGVPFAIPLADYDKSHHTESFAAGKLVSQLALGALAPVPQDPAGMTDALVKLMGPNGFYWLLSQKSMTQALENELKTGTLLQSVLTDAKLSAVMKGKVMNVRFAVQAAALNFERYFEIQIDSFTDNDQDLLRQKHLLKPGAQPVGFDDTSLEATAAKKFAGMLDLGHLLEPSGAFSADLLRFLEASGILLRLMHADEGALLKSVLDGRRMHLTLEEQRIPDVVVETIYKHEDSACQKDKGGCDGNCSDAPIASYPPEQETFVTEMRRGLVGQLAAGLKVHGCNGLIAALNGKLVEAMLSEGGVLDKLMTTDFVRRLLVGWVIRSNRVEFGVAGSGPLKKVKDAVNSIPGSHLVGAFIGKLVGPAGDAAKRAAGIATPDLPVCGVMGP